MFVCFYRSESHFFIIIVEQKTKKLPKRKETLLAVTEQLVSSASANHNGDSVVSQAKFFAFGNYTYVSRTCS